MILKCILVEDSSVQRLFIYQMIKSSKFLRCDVIFSNALEANNYLLNNPVDLIFLDVEMPDINGFDLLDGLKTKPQIIFVTAKPEYAFKAFDYDATDYLCKPIEKERFEISVNKALSKFNSNNNSEILNGDFIIFKSNLKNHKILIDSIKWIEAMGDYVKVVTDYESYVVLKTMKAFLLELPKNQFLRVHKSYIVNLKRVNKFSARFLELEKSQIPLSRNIKNKLTEALLNI